MKTREVVHENDGGTTTYCELSTDHNEFLTVAAKHWLGKNPPTGRDPEQLVELYEQEMRQHFHGYENIQEGDVLESFYWYRDWLSSAWGFQVRRGDQIIASTTVGCA